MNEKMKKVRDKVEDGIVKAYNWTQKHPVLTMVGTTVLGSVVTGVIAYKKGYHDSSVDAGEFIQGDPCEVSLHCHENGIYAPKNETEYFAHDLTQEDIDGPRSNIILGSLLMKLNCGDGAVVWKTRDDNIDIWAIEDPDTMACVCADLDDLVSDCANLD